MPIIAISLLIQIGLVIHVLKTGRDRYWITILLLVPGIGAAAYTIIELVPAQLNTIGGQRSIRNVKKVINPNRELNQAYNSAEISDTFENRLRLGNELVERGHHEEAIETLQGGLTGLFEFDPVGLATLARAQFGSNNFDAAKSSLDTLIHKNPEYKNQDAHLLYARCLEGLNDTTAATAEYDALIRYYTGPEPHVRYAQMLLRNGQDQRAQELLSDVLNTSRTSAKHYTRLHKPWINKAKQLLET